MDIIDIKSSAYAVYCLKMKYKNFGGRFRKNKGNNQHNNGSMDI